MLKTILIQSAKYLQASVDMVERDKIDNNKYKSIKKKVEIKYLKF